MKDIYVAEVTNQRIKKFNEAKAKGIHLPFISASTMSAGTKSIFWCPKQQRTIFTLSQGEKRFYLTKIYSPNVISIKEQYPLDYTITSEIANKNKVIHPRDHVTGKLQVMTTDFVVECRNANGSVYREAYWFKPEQPLRGRKRTEQKCDIEEKYWKQYGVTYHRILGRDVCRIQAANYHMLSEYYEVNASIDVFQRFTDAFFQSIVSYPASSLKNTLLDTASRLNLDSRIAYRLFANAVLYQLLPVDTHQLLEFAEPVRLRTA
jgi:hypothetical protein